MSDLSKHLRSIGNECVALGYASLRHNYFDAADELDRLNAQALELCAEISKLTREHDALAARLAEADKLIDEAAQDRAMTFTPWRVKVRAYHQRYFDAALGVTESQPTASQRMTAAGYTRRPTLPSDADDRDDEVTANPTTAFQHQWATKGIGPTYCALCGVTSDQQKEAPSVGG